MTVLIRPVITEKSLSLVQVENKYTFLVNSSTNKIEVRKVIEEKYGVSVINVRILNTLGKLTAFGRKRIPGKRSDSKKAIITLKKGDSIPEFEIK